MGKTDKESANRKNRTICLPFSQENYESILYDPIDCRRYIDQINAYFPELFSPEITKGYRMKEIKWSKKLKIDTRRFEIDGVAYTTRPSFVMPYMTGFTEEFENAVFLRKFLVITDLGERSLLTGLIAQPPLNPL